MARPEWEADLAEYFAVRYVPLRRLAYALCGNWHTAEDLVQMTFVQLYRHWRRIRGETIDAYARRILVNACLTSRRDGRRERVVAEVPERAALLGADVGDVVDIGRALATLPPRQRALVVLRYLEDMSVADAAVLLGVAEGTVKSQTALGVQKLRAALGVDITAKE